MEEQSRQPPPPPYPFPERWPALAELGSDTWLVPAGNGVLGAPTTEYFVAASAEPADIVIEGSGAEEMVAEDGEASLRSGAGFAVDASWEQRLKTSLGKIMERRGGGGGGGRGGGGGDRGGQGGAAGTGAVKRKRRRKNRSKNKKGKKKRAAEAQRQRDDALREEERVREYGSAGSEHISGLESLLAQVYASARDGAASSSHR